MGLSIVAARGTGQQQLGIYIKVCSNCISSGFYCYSFSGLPRQSYFVELKKITGKNDLLRFDFVLLVRGSRW